VVVQHLDPRHRSLQSRSARPAETLIVHPQHGRARVHAAGKGV